MSPEKTSKSLKATKAFLKFYKDNFLILVCTKLIAIGLLFRFWVISSSLGNIDEKQALVLLQAKDFSKGNFSTMREGRFTGGSLETLLNIPVVAIFGTTKTSTWIIPLLLLAATSYVLWRSFVNTPHKETMRIVMACLWISPAYFVISSSRATGHVALEIFLYACLFASAYYAAHSLRNLRYFYLWAFLSGATAWINPASIVFSCVCLFWIFISAPALKKNKTRALAYFVLGSSLLWVHVLEVINSNGKLSLASMGIDANSEFPKNALTTLGQLIGISPYSENDFSFSDINFLLGFLCVVLLSTIFYSAYRLKHEKRTDFRKLQMYIFFVFCAIPLFYLITNNDLLPEVIVPAIIPMLFLVIGANKSRKYISAVVTLLFIISALSISVSIDSVSASENLAVSRLTKSLETQKINTAIASHKISFPITAKSNDEILVTPFDGNDFSKTRAKKVHENVEAIVVDTTIKNQTDLAFCIQGTFGKTFKAVQISSSFDILIVDKNLRGKIWGVVQKCNDRV